MPTEPIARKNRNVNITERHKQRFWDCVHIKGPDECWSWLGRRDSDNNYGDFNFDYRYWKAHRFALFITRPFDLDLLALHSCDNPPCCNPAHLFPGTQADNVADKTKKGRQSKGEKHAAIMRKRDLKGDKNPSRIHPERLARGDRHNSVTKPWTVPRGDRNGSRTKPESVPKGQDHGNAKLTDEIVLIMRREHKAGISSATELGIRYGVTMQCVWYAINKGWKHLG